MIKTEEVDSSSNGLLYNNSRNSTALPPLPPLSAAPSLHHYSMIPPSGSILSDLNTVPGSHHSHLQHAQQQHYAVHRHHLEADEKPHLSYLNRHILQNSSIHGHPMDMLPPPPLSSSPLNVNKSAASPSTIVYSTSTTSTPQIHDFGTASTIKYCSSNGLEILPVQPQHAYVIQQCPSSEPANRVNEMPSHEDRMDTNAHQQMQCQQAPHTTTVLSSSSSNNSTNIANHGSSGGQLEMVHYAGVPSQQKKDPASPISTGSASPSDEQLPPDTTKKSNNSRRPEKPNMSYINMIACAIKESPDRMLTLNGIYNYLQQK